MFGDFGLDGPCWYQFNAPLSSSSNLIFTAIFLTFFAHHISLFRLLSPPIIFCPLAFLKSNFFSYIDTVWHPPCHAAPWLSGGNRVHVMPLCIYYIYFGLMIDNLKLNLNHLYLLKNCAPFSQKSRCCGFFFIICSILCCILS